MRNASQRSNNGSRVVKRSVSERHLGEILLSDALDGADQSNNGDVLTKVAIPRSKSFMTVPQQNYSFSELFEELKVSLFTSYICFHSYICDNFLVSRRNTKV